MSDIRRAYTMLRAYVNREWDRVAGSDFDTASQELDESLRTGVTRTTPSQSPTAQAPEVDQITLARQILGVTPEATFDDVQKAYDRLNKRTDPSRFPAGSPEQVQAQELQRRVNIAYHKLAAAFSETERRFKTLEID